MYDPIFAKSFSRYERKRFGFFALILCFILALSICSTFKPHLHPLSLIGDAIKLQLSIDSAEDVTLVMDETNRNSEPTDDIVADDLEENISTVRANNTTQQTDDDTGAEVDDSSAEASRNDPEVILDKVNMTSAQLIGETKEAVPIKPLCRILESDADYCEIEGDVRIDPNSSTVFLVSPHPTVPESMTWNIQPYPRRGIKYVKKWTVKTTSDDENITRIPQCARNHTFPALLLSLGGYSGNLFHDFSDLLHPLYSTSFQFHKQVHLLASDYKPWWASKYRAVLDGLTKHALIDIDRESTVHCFKKTIIGVNLYKELTAPPQSNSSPTMRQFRQFLREAYSLERTNAIKLKKGRHPRRGKTRPRLMIISRRRTRIITNEAEVSSLAEKMGFEVVIAEADVSTDLTRFAQTVNSCDVLMGIHGAGLTNMVFLPDNAVLIQVVPLGGIDVLAKMDFGDPSSGMNVRYVEYGIKLEESSLSRTYRSDDPVITDPLSLHRQGWLKLRSVYLDNQNVAIDLRRFRGALARAVKLLRR